MRTKKRDQITKHSPIQKISDFCQIWVLSKTQMSNPNSKLPKPEDSDDSTSMEIDNEIPEVETAEISIEGIENDDELPQILSSGTVDYQGVVADYFEFEANDHDFGILSNIMSTGSNTPKVLSLNNSNSNPKKTDAKENAERKAAIRKAFAEAVAKNRKDNQAKPNGPDDDPFNGITLDSVGGLESQIDWLKQCILKPLKTNNANNVWGIKPPKGILFHGVPGCGKTLLARAFGNALSQELGTPVKFFHRKGGDTFSQWFGESSENLRRLFKEAIENKPSILFFDELDGLCPSRDGNTASEAYNTVVTTLLGLMDTLTAGEVFVIGATNRLDAIDAAMRRPGRFDKHLEFLPPNQDGRKRIFEINTGKWKMSSRPSIQDLEKLGQNTVGFTGADIENLCREAFFTAFNRHNPGADMDATIDDMEVLDEDWTVALKKIKPTNNSAIYGSTLYTPCLPDKAINPLVVNIQEEIVKEMIPILPRCSASASSLTLEDDEESSYSLPSYLIWDKGCGSTHVLESLIIPGVLVHEALSHLPVYILSQKNILQERQENQLSYITKTINQAFDSFKPCILYIPRFDDLIKDLQGYMPYISRQILQLRGKSVLLLATSSRPATSLDCEFIVQNLFGYDNSLYLRKSSKQERTNFFCRIFRTATNTLEDGTIDPNVPEKRKQQFEKLLESCVDKTEGDGIEVLLGLHDSLLKTCGKHLDDTKGKDSLPGVLTEVLKRFSINKLRY